MKIPTALFLVSMLAAAAPAQALEPYILHHFTEQAGSVGPLVEGVDGNFYGATPSGGSAGRGRVFRMTPAGAVTTLVNFTGPNGQGPWTVGLTPDRDGNLYGTTEQGGRGGRGTVFKVTLEGVLTTLVHFDNTNGAAPRGLTMGGDGHLYGTTATSTRDQGTVFKLTTDGIFTPLTGFPASYGSYPAGLTVGGDGILYGRTYNGNNGQGTVYRVSADGPLITLASLSGCDHAYSTSLTLGHDGNFYGTTFGGGSSGRGRAFRVTPRGRLTTLVNFVGDNGMLPAGPLTLGRDGNFYGTTVYGGVFEGTVFRMTPEGALTTLANFVSRSTGVRPYGGVIFGSDGSLYGTATTGGSGDRGVIFRLDLPPTIITPPASQNHALGATATFSVTVAGTKPLSYQWLKDQAPLVDGDRLAGASTATLTLANVQAGDAGAFTVVITNAWGSVTSVVAVLTVGNLDPDGDGVLDIHDVCPDTAPGAIVDEHGCSIEQLVPCAGPVSGGTWKSHGKYVSAVRKAATAFHKAGLITKSEKKAILKAAVRSDCGRKKPSGK